MKQGLGMRSCGCGIRCPGPRRVGRRCSARPVGALDAAPNHLDVVQHGIARRAGGGRLAIRAARAGETVRLEVSDDGVGLARHEREAHREGIGLANTRERLQRLYGDAHRFTLVGGDGDGVTVTIEIPLRRAPADTFGDATPEVRA